MPKLMIRSILYGLPNCRKTSLLKIEIDTICIQCRHPVHGNEFAHGCEQVTQKYLIPSWTCLEHDYLIKRPTDNQLHLSPISAW